MADDGFTPAGAADVKLKTVRAVLQREIKGGDGIFRRVTAGAAMSEE